MEEVDHLQPNLLNLFNNKEMVTTLFEVGKAAQCMNVLEQARAPKIPRYPTPCSRVTKPVGRIGTTNGGHSFATNKMIMASY